MNGVVDYKLLTCTRYDPLLLGLKWNNESDGTPSPFLLLRFHVARLVEAAERHTWPAAKAALSLNTIKSTCQALVDQYTANGGQPQPLKIRLVLDEAGVLSGSASVVDALPSAPIIPSAFNPDMSSALRFGPIYNIYLDTQPSPVSLFTWTKTTHRPIYDAARSRRALPSGANSSNHIPDDILLYNEHGLITETTIFNVAIYRDSNWMTPSTSTGCLPGVLRRWLLELGRVNEDTTGRLTIDSIKNGDWILIFNGVAGCRLGRIVK